MLERMRRFLRPIVLAALGTLLGGADGCALDPQAKVAAFGDSVTWGYGGAPGGWVPDVEHEWGHSIANLGIPGETAQTGRRRISGPFGLFLAPSAKTVLILEGGNDAIHFLHASPCGKHCLPSLVPQRFENLRGNLEGIRHAAAGHGRKIVFGTYWPASFAACKTQFTQDEFDNFRAFITRANEILVDVAAENGDPIVRLDDLLDLPNDVNNYYDCYHPSAKGYAIIAKRWMQDVDVWAPPVDGTWDDGHE